MKKILLLLTVSALSLSGCNETTGEVSQNTEKEVGQLIENESENLETQAQETETEENIVEETEKKPVEETETELKSTEMDVTENKQAIKDESTLRSEAIDLAAEDLQTSPDTLKVLIALVKEDKVDLTVYFEGILYDYEIKNSKIEKKDIEAELEQDLIDEFFIGNDALRIALEDTGIDIDEAKDIDIEFENKNDKYYYEVSFEDETTDFEYKIDARTGEILEKSM